MRKTSRNLWIFCFLIAFWIFDCEALCGFNRTASPDVAILNTPGYPRNYNSSQDCQWTLEATSGYQVQFTVHSGESEACCDYLEVFDGPSIYSPSLERVKGTVLFSRCFTSTTRHLTVRFVSDDSIERRGFNGSYNLNRIECVARSDPANSISRPSKSLWFVNDNVTYSCQDGYQLLGSATSRCDNNGEWTNDLPVCAALPESRFHLTDVELNFDQSRQHCRSLGGDLAIIQNQQEQDYLSAKAKRLYPGGVTFYIGLKRVGSAWIFNRGHLQWINGKRVSDGFQSWNTGEPNYGGANENCVIMYIAEETFWNDIACGRRFFAACETVYDPCINNPCLNGGNCFKRKNTFSCECPVYVDGDRCENVIQCPAPVLHPSLNTVPSRNADSYRVGTRFNLTCDIGKVFVGNPKNIECQRNGAWSETSGVCSTCASRNLTAAQALNHRCGEMCQEDSGRCRRGKICKCDHECGYSCISRRNTCGHPPLINHTQSTQVKRNRNGKISLVPYPPYQYDDFVEYVCGPGFELSQFKPTICQSRRRWTRGRTFCIRTCEDNNINDTARNVLSCRDRCIFEKDCNHGEQCLCDGNCGRSCVNPDIDCGEAPTSSNAAINYAGQGFYRVAHYSCAEGFYLVSGSPRRKCTGRGIYDGNLPECARVKCFDPFVAFQATGGVVPQNRTDNYSVDAQVKFRCPSTHRLLGPTSRTCLTDGRWSGQDSACDVIDATTRCPHPGVPINGRLVTNGNFSVGSVIQFRCDPGYVMLGEHEQECMYFLQWSNLGAPQCIDTDISNINVRAIDQVQNSLEELRDSPRTTRGVGGRIRVTFAYENVEIYLVVDISSSKGENCFHQSLDILTKILSEMYGSENTNFRISLIAYATRADAVHQPEPGDSVFSKEDILQKLKDLIDDKDKLRKKLGSSSNLNKALHLLITLTKLSPKTKKLIYITSCGIEHRDEFDENTVLEQNSVNQFKAHFKKQISEIFVILVCLKCKSTLENSDNVLLSIASSYDHAFVVKDSSQYIDPLRGVAQPETDKTEAGKSCGKAGDTTMVKKRALQLFARNKESKNGAWPWHAVITTKVVIRRKIKDKIHGGGSLIDNRWVLTAAHLFAECNFSDPNWHLDFRVILGAHRLNMAKKMFQSNAKTFEPEKIILHENYKIDLSEGILPDLDFDVAVIKLGREYDLRGNDKFFASARSGSLNYTSLIRPVCLPCMENNCVKGWADSQKKMTSNRSETQSTEDSCAVEENMFMTHKHSVTVIIGFGKTANEETSQHLLQGRVKIKSRNECSTVLPQMRHANNEAAKPLKRNFTYTNRMLCALGEYGGYVTDAGPGDSGGALTREIYDEATKTSCWIQLGIVSWGYDNDNLFSTNGTRRNFPGYYTNVFSVLNWIKDKVHPPQDATCEAPEEIPHGSINGNMTYNQTITYSCDEGYFLKGNRTRRCRSDRKWSGSQPTCHAFCSVPKPQRNGYANNFQDTLLPGSVVNYVCKLGYVMSGSPLVRCQEGGNWSELRFSCSKKRCPEPLVPDNGYKEGNDYTFGNRVYFFCNEGYTLLERQNYRKCSANGEWSGQLPTCEVVICPVPVAPNQGSVDTILTEYPYNTRVHYSCQRDFKIVGSAIGVCDENGSWSDAPSCEVDNDCNFDNFNRPFCRYENIRSRWRRVSSANVPFGSRGFVARLDSESLSLPANEVATLRSPSVDSDQGLCLKFYYLLRTLRHGEDFVVMISSSSNAKREIWRSNSKERKNSWLNADIRIDPSLRNVSVEFVARKSRTRFPTSLDLDEISLSSSDQCENECEGVACHNGGTCRNRINSFECLCRSGYRGTNCETRISCQILNIPNTAYQPVQTTYYFGDRITYSCNRGFRQMVPGDLTCGQSGQWTRDGQVLTESRHPSCSQTFCPPPVVTAPVQLHRQGQLVGPFLVGRVVQFQCANLNHNPVGAQSVRCLNTGSWSDPPPNTCVDPDAIPRECPRLRQPANGSMQRVGNIELYRIGSVARFSCNDGYRRDGQSHLVCEPSYTWSDSVPTCQMKGCVISRPPTSLIINFIPSKEYPVRHRLEALCSANRSRQITLTCLGRSQWNPQINSELC